MIGGILKRGGVFLRAGGGMGQKDVGVEQEKLWKEAGENMYVTISKTLKGEMPYDQAAIDSAITELEANVVKIPTVFATNPKEDVANATFGSSQKIWQNKA